MQKGVQDLKLFSTLLPLILLLSSNLALPHLFAQSSSTIQGRVTNKDSGEPLPSVNIILVGTRFGAASDTSGHYLIHAAAGEYRVQASAIGFETQVSDRFMLAAGETHVVDFHLTPKPVELKPVDVEAERVWEKFQTDVSLVGIQRVRQKEITSIPGAFDDPTRAVLLRSGATGAGDYSSFLTIRGSSPEQNLVVLDGVTIPNPYRFRLAMGGGMSVFDAKTTEDMHLHLAGYTAEYGNALSSVLEVETRTGNLERFRFGGGVNLTDAGAVIEGPIVRGKASFLLSARRTYLDLIAERVTENTSSVYPFFYDVTGKWAFHLNGRNRLTLSIAASREETELSSVLSESVNMTEGAQTRNAILSWRKVFGNGRILQTTLSYYHDETGFRAFPTFDSLAVDTLASDYERLSSRNDRMALQQNLRSQLSKGTWLNLGWSAAAVDSRINFRSLERNFYFARNDIPRDVRFDKNQGLFAGFAEHTAEIGEKVQTRAGLRYDYSTLFNEGELSHRLSARYKLDSLTTIEASWGDFYQFPDPLTLSIRDQPLEIGANVDVISAEKATHKVLGLKRMLPHAIRASVELYHIDIDRLLVADDRQTFEPFNQGRGRLTGLEVVVEKLSTPITRLSGLVSYSMGYSQYHDLTDRNWVPFNYDRRHSLTAWLNQRIGWRWQLSLLWRFASGLPYTEVLGVAISQDTKGNTNWDFIRSARNEVRFPSYQRLDARLSYSAGSHDRSLLLYLDFINLYDHRNVYNMTWEKLPSDNKNDTIEQAKRRTIYMLPFLPSMGMQFSF